MSERLANGCSCGHVTLAGREYARYVDPADMGERILPTSFSLRTVHDAIRAIEAEAAALSSPETTPAGVLDEAALAFMEHVQAQGCDHAESKAGSHTGCPQVLALAAALGRSGSGGGRG